MADYGGGGDYSTTYGYGYDTSSGTGYGEPYYGGSDTGGNIGPSGYGGGAYGALTADSLNLLLPSARKLSKKQRAYMRDQANLRVDELARQQAILPVEQQRQTAALQQSEFGRGLGQSSIAQSDESFLGQKQGIESANTAEELQTAQANLAYVNAQIAYSRQSPYIKIFSDIMEIAGQAAQSAAGAM